MYKLSVDCSMNAKMATVDISAPAEKIEEGQIRNTLLPYVTKFKRDALLNTRASIVDNFSICFDGFSHLQDAIKQSKVGSSI